MGKAGCNSGGSHFFKWKRYGKHIHAYLCTYVLAYLYLCVYLHIWLQKNMSLYQPGGSNRLPERRGDWGLGRSGGCGKLKGSGHKYSNKRQGRGVAAKTRSVWFDPVCDNSETPPGAPLPWYSHLVWSPPLRVDGTGDLLLTNSMVKVMACPFQDHVTTASSLLSCWAALFTLSFAGFNEVSHRVERHS